MNYDLDELYGKNRSDCERILEDVEDVFENISDCLDAVLDERRGKREVVGGIFGVGKSLFRLGVRGTGCLIKNTPKAITTVASIKRNITRSIEEEYKKAEKERRERELQEKIRRLKTKP